MSRSLFYLFPLLLYSISGFGLYGQEKQRFSKTFAAMGTRFDIILIHEEKEVLIKAQRFSQKEIERIEKLISSWKPHSQTSLINQNSGRIPVKVDHELFALIAESLEISGMTKGAFDLSFGAANRLYTFDRKERSLPSKEEMQSSVQFVGFDKIFLDDAKQTVFLQEKNMAIGFGAIGKGYVAERLKVRLQMIGIENGLINAGGDLVAWGKNEKDLPWRLGIADPNQSDGLIGTVVLGDASMVTSGNAEKYFLQKGKRYAHIIDPRTGKATRGLKSVTVLAERGSLADALATAIFVLGKRKGLKLAKSLSGVEVLIITDKDRVFTTQGFTYTPVP